MAAQAHDVMSGRPEGAANERPLVFIPGFMLDRDLWTDVEQSLSGFAPTLHPDLRRATSIEDMAEKALNLSPERFTLVGFSMGGYVARVMARLAPDRVERLVLIATSCRADTQAQHLAKIAAKVDPDKYRGISRSAIRRSLSPSRDKDDALVGRIRQMSQRLGPETYLMQLAFRRDGDCDRLAEIRCPTLIVAGREDRLRTPSEALELLQRIPQARKVVIPAGHMVPLEAPGELALVLRAFV